MGDERRKDPRIPMRVEAEVKFTSWAVYSLIYTINISKGGMNLDVPEEQTVGSKLTIKLTPPTGNQVQIEAVVKHAAKNGKRWSVGVEFDNLDAATREIIEKAIREHGVVLPPMTPRSK